MDKNSTLRLSSGNLMPVLALGTWQLTNNTAEIVALSLDLGYRHIDTSSDYGSQPGIGEGIKNSEIDRGDLFVTTKVEETDDAYERTLSNLEELGVDYIDLELIHRPPDQGVGEKLWEGLLKARREGLVKDIGVSNYRMDQIDLLIKDSGEIPAVNQIEWSPFGHSEEMMRYAKDKNMIVQAYSPLTRTTKFDNKTLQEVASKYNKTPAQILVRWNLQIGTVPLPKANNKDHLKENIEVFDFEIEDGDVMRLNDLNENYSSLGSLPYV